MDQWSVLSGTEVKRKNWPNSTNFVLLMVEKEERNSHLSD